MSSSTTTNWSNWGKKLKDIPPTAGWRYKWIREEFHARHIEQNKHFVSPFELLNSHFQVLNERHGVEKLQSMINKNKRRRTAPSRYREPEEAFIFDSPHDSRAKGTVVAHMYDLTKVDKRLNQLYSDNLDIEQRNKEKIKVWKMLAKTKKEEHNKKRKKEYKRIKKAIEQQKEQFMEAASREKKHAEKLKKIEVKHAENLKNIERKHAMKMARLRKEQEQKAREINKKYEDFVTNQNQFTYPPLPTLQPLLTSDRIEVKVDVIFKTILFDILNSEIMRLVQTKATPLTMIDGIPYLRKATVSLKTLSTSRYIHSMFSKILPAGTYRGNNLKQMSNIKIPKIVTFNQMVVEDEEEVARLIENIRGGTSIISIDVNYGIIINYSWTDLNATIKIELMKTVDEPDCTQTRWVRQ
jgi:hypothetical protein